MISGHAHGEPSAAMCMNPTNSKSKVVEVIVTQAQNDSSSGEPNETCSTHQSHKFQVIGNLGGGNCLFSAVAQFLNLRTSSEPTTGSDVRRECVDFVLKPDAEDPTKYSNWNRFRFDIAVNLRNQNAFFRTYEPAEGESPDNNWKEVQARKNYGEYMRQSGHFGTATELVALMERYDFGVTLFQQKDMDQSYFDVYHLNPEPRESQAHMLFTGDPMFGHFELLNPVGPSKSLLGAAIPSQTYKVKAVHEARMTTYSLVPAVYMPTPKSAKPRQFNQVDPALEPEETNSGARDYWKNHSPVGRGCCGGGPHGCNKRPKLQNVVRRSGIHPEECCHILEFFSNKLQEIEAEFCEHPSTRIRVVEGIYKSDVFTIGGLNSQFVMLEPKASTASTTKCNTSVVVCGGGVVSFSSFCPNDGFQSSESNFKGTFRILKDVNYRLENKSPVCTLLLRTFWFNDQQ